MTKQITIAGNFTDEQLTKLRTAYAGIETVNPTGPAMLKINAWVARYCDETLDMLIAANIKWISSKARTEKTLRSFGSTLG